MKRFVTLFIILTMALAGCSNEGTETTQIKDGVYSATSSGYNGDTTVEVTVENQGIKDIQITDTADTEAIVERAFPLLKERIIDEQTPIIDSVSSATYSSFAVKKATAEALTQAGFEFEDVTMSTKSAKEDTKVYEDVKTTLVIAGAGPSGLGAAIEAKENGVDDIIIIEKLDILSGNGKFDEFFFDFANTKAQADLGIIDTKEDFKATLESYGGFDSPAELQKRVDEVFMFDAWLREHGIEANKIDQDRTHMAEEEVLIGDYTQKILEKAVKDLGIEVRTNTKLTDLIMDGNKATGIVVETNGQSYNIMADRVLVATGGFCSNNELVKEYIPSAANYESSNSIGATGDMIPIAKKHNIKLSNMDVPQLFNIMTPNQRFELEPKSYGSIIVNKNGERFVDELDYYSTEFGDALLAQEGGVGYFIYTQEKVDERTAGLGIYNKSDSLEELANKLGLNHENLVKSIEEFNHIAKGEKEDPFNSDIQMPVIGLDSTAYYGTPIIPSIHMTYGGVETDEFTKVYNNDGEVVENLYASGEVAATTGIYLESIIFGKVAGEEIAKSLK